MVTVDSVRALLHDPVTGRTAWCPMGGGDGMFAVQSFEDRDEALHRIAYPWREGNWSCDCNRRLDLYRDDDRSPYPDDERGTCSGGPMIRLVDLVAVIDGAETRVPTD